MDATLKALDAFSGGLWVILGGKDKGLDYAPLRAPLAEKAHAVLLIGAAARRSPPQLDGAVPLIDVAHARCRHRPRVRAADAGDTVLLAPACASFDQFRSFEHRGETFKHLVSQLETAELMAQRLKTDWILFATVLAMVVFGVLILYSASSIMAELNPRYGSSWYFVLRQWPGRWSPFWP